MITEQVLEDFARISPKWAELYQTYKFDVLVGSTFCKKDLCKNDEDRSNMSKKVLNINNSVCCVLGEAHGFEEAHTYASCGKCYEFSHQFNDVGEKGFESLITPFVKHFKRVHPKLFKAKK